MRLRHLIVVVNLLQNFVGSAGHSSFKSVYTCSCTCDDGTLNVTKVNSCDQCNVQLCEELLDCPDGTDEASLFCSFSSSERWEHEHHYDCFHGDSTVKFEDGTERKMRTVKPGDKILTANAARSLSFSEVVYLPHRKNGIGTTFVLIKTSTGREVKATPRHLFMTCTGKEVSAKDLLGECVLTIDGSEIIEYLTEVYHRGAYTLVTASEFLVVNGFIASPFAFNHYVTHRYYNAHRLVYAHRPKLLEEPLFVTFNMLLGDAATSAFRAFEELKTFYIDGNIIESLNKSISGLVYGYQ